MKRRIKTILQYMFFFGLGFFFVWLSVKDIDAEKWQQIRFALANANYLLVIPVFFILIGSHYVRSLRWRLLMEPMGYLPSRTNVFFAVMVGYLANQGVPRLGEVLRCTLLARYEKIPADKLIGTIILERMIDAVCLLMVFGITLAIQPGLYGQIINQVFHSKNEAGADDGAGWLIPLLFIALVFIIVITWMVVKKKSWSDLLRGVRQIIIRVMQGLGTIRHLRKRGQFILLTLLLWTLYLAGGWIGLQALQETQQYGVQQAFTILSAGSIGMIVSPGGIGGCPLLIEGTMMLYGLSQPIAAAFGWLLWIAQTFVVLVGGLISFSLLPWYNRRKNKENNNSPLPPEIV
ncbi:MAG TPA: lysylphosphatidylglycerol synthase transmembrane domain-containing protein [Chitinophagaceae bacterium]|nr:lysylphosphatidylglycerol synthase transmembrane domain-containing protein [Chitinophagaceae bacterium]